MIYMESCIVESILGIHVSWPVLFNDWYLMTSGLISNIPLIIKILKDGGITREHSSDIQNLVRHAYRVKPEHHIHMSLCERCILDYVNLWEDV